jgi:gamma-glutamyltranspeptidase/glutathione hydrolase
MVATGNAHATDAALAVLAAGGNAVDAAVCAALVLAVVAPYACTLGGDLYALLYVPGKGVVAGLNGTGASPSSATADRFEGGLPRTGIRSATVPGLLRALDDLIQRHGTWSFARVAEPAIALAERGFTVYPTLAENTSERAELLARDPAAAALFLPGGAPLAEGALFVQSELARVLRTVAGSGVEAFYSGPLAAQFAHGVAAAGGDIALDDLREHASLWQTPMTAPFYGHEVWTMPPNSYGPTLLLQLIELESGRIDALEPDSVDFIAHGFAARKNAYKAATPWIADPRLGEKPARAYLAGARDGAASPPHEPRDRCTTTASVIDSDGLAVSLIESVSAPYGSGVVVEGTGILLNNRLAGFTDDPGHANAIGPRKRPANTLAPALVTRGGRLLMTLGTPGTVGQTATLAQFLARTLACGEEVAAAAAAPRWSVDFQGKLIVEQTMAPALRAQVSERFPEARAMPCGWISFGSIKLATVVEDGLLGVADYRRAATVAGL